MVKADDMIKILHCVSIMNRAGQETFLMNVFRNINRKEFMFNFLCTNEGKGDYDDEIYALGGKIFTLDAIQKRGKLRNFNYQVKKLAEWFSSHRNEFDIVHVHTYHNLDVLKHLRAAKKANVKIVIHSHNSSGPHHLMHKLLRPICNRYKHAMFACSKLAGEWLYGRRAVRSGKVTVINNGIDVQKFKFDEIVREEYRRKLGLDGFTVWGHIGRFNYQKNHEFLLSAFYEYKKENHKAKLLIIGQGELEDKIKNQIAELKLENDVSLLGVRDDIERIMNAFDCFVFPSLFEGLGIVLIETQANGLPIVVSKEVPDEVVCNENVVKLPIRDVMVWKNTILSVDLKRTENIRVGDYNIQNTVQQLEKAYREMCDNFVKRT